MLQYSHCGAVTANDAIPSQPQLRRTSTAVTEQAATKRIAIVVALDGASTSGGARSAPSIPSAPTRRDSQRTARVLATAPAARARPSATGGAITVCAAYAIVRKSAAIAADEAATAASVRPFFSCNQTPVRRSASEPAPASTARPVSSIQPREI